MECPNCGLEMVEQEVQYTAIHQKQPGQTCLGCGQTYYGSMPQMRSPTELTDDPAAVLKVRLQRLPGNVIFTVIGIIIAVICIKINIAALWWVAAVIFAVFVVISVIELFKTLVFGIALTPIIWFTTDKSKNKKVQTVITLVDAIETAIGCVLVYYLYTVLFPN